MKYRAVLTGGYSVIHIKRGPERDEKDDARLDLTKLEQAYPGHSGTVIKEGNPLYGGETDSIFDPRD